MSSTPHPIDVHVGKRIRQRRWMLGMTQQELAKEVGVRFQQVQKYETGKNRISASRLWEVSRVLGVPISYFFEGLREREFSFEDYLAQPTKETFDLIRSYKSLPGPQRSRLLDLARALGKD